MIRSVEAHRTLFDTTHQNLREDTFVVDPSFFDVLDSDKLDPEIRTILDHVTRSYLFYIQAAAQYAGTTWAPDIVVPVLRKITHTNDVIRAISELIERRPQLWIHKKAAIITAITHDWMRAFQGWFFAGEYSDYLDNFSHPKEAALRLAELYGEDHPITRAVLGHGSLKPADEHELSFAIRDADKLAILRRIFELQRQLQKTREQLFSADYLPDETRALYEKYLSQSANDAHPELLRSLREKRLGKSEYRSNELNEFLYCLAWIFDVEFQETRELLVQERIPEQLVNYITHLTTDGEVISCVEEVVASWYQEYGLGKPDYTLQSSVSEFTKRWGFVPNVPRYLLRDSD